MYKYTRASYLPRNIDPFFQLRKSSQRLHHRPEVAQGKVPRECGNAGHLCSPRGLQAWLSLRQYRILAWHLDKPAQMHSRIDGDDDGSDDDSVIYAACIRRPRNFLYTHIYASIVNLESRLV